MNTTVITALYNIQRETKGDKRKWSDYLTWFEQTLKLQMPMCIFTSPDLEPFIKTYRPPHLKTKIVTDQPIPYAYLEHTIKTILDSEQYKKLITHPTRVECILPMYNVIQYSKFKWLKQIASENPFQTDYFFWMDAGISRFIDTNATLHPTIQLPPNKLTIQKNHLYDIYPITEKYLWDSQCLLCGTIFGGDAESIHTMESIIHDALIKGLENNWSNNEQILLAYMSKINPDLFNLVLNNTPFHVCLFQQKMSC